MNKRCVLSVCVLLGWLAGGELGLGAREMKVPVIVELFTSEGCSSCPPADQLLARLGKLDENQVEIVPLSQHVDYWNYLGWSDPFSKPIFTQRQRLYAQKFKQSSIYTPEMIVDGVESFVGSSSERALDSIKGRRTAKKEPLEVSIKAVGKDFLDIQIEASPDSRSKASSLFLCITEDGISVPVRGGENAGKKLKHDGVVRVMHQLKRIPTMVISKRLALAADWRRENLKVVAFTQDQDSLEIRAASAVRVN